MMGGAFAEALTTQLELAKERLLAEHARTLDSALKQHKPAELVRLQEENAELRAQNVRLQQELLGHSTKVRNDMAALAESMKEVAQLHLLADRSAAADAARKEAEEEAAKERDRVEEERKAREAEEARKREEEAEMRLAEQRRAEREQEERERLRVAAERDAENQRRIAEEEAMKAHAEEAARKEAEERHRAEEAAREKAKEEERAKEARKKAAEEELDRKAAEAAKKAAEERSHTHTSEGTTSGKPKAVQSPLELALKAAANMVPGMSDQKHDGGPVWIVVGGADQGGILVRQAKSMHSPGYQTRLRTGTKVEELEIEGKRLHYKRIRGEGPDFGWVSIEGTGSKKLMEPLPDHPRPT